MASTASAMPRAKPRQYRDFLTPALHRQFTRAFLLGCGVCYAESVLLGSWRDALWSWFPLGFAGIRTLLLCIPMLAVFFIRVSNNHGELDFLNCGLVLLTPSSWHTHNHLSFPNLPPASHLPQQPLAVPLLLLRLVLQRDRHLVVPCGCEPSLGRASPWRQGPTE